MRNNLRYRLPAFLLSAVAVVSLGHAASYTPVTLAPGSFTHDLVVEKTASAALVPGGYTTASMDGGTNNNGNTWYEIGYNRDVPTSGLPLAGSIFDALAPTNTHRFQFAPSYAEPNAIMLDAGHFRSATFTLTSPAPYSHLSFLTSGGNGGVIFRYTIHYQGGATQVGTNQSADWFFVNNWAIATDGRVDAQSYALNNVGMNPPNPRLYAKDVAVSDPATPITAVDVEYIGGDVNGHTAFMALSGATTASSTFQPIPFSGYNADIVVEASAPRPAAITGVTTATMDGGLGNTNATYFEKGYVPSFPNAGLPESGSTFTSVSNPDRTYKVESYTGNNALLIDADIPNGVFTLATPQSMSGISLLAASASGASSVEVVVNHQDGTSQTNILSIPDWYNATSVAWITRGRVQTTTGLLQDLRSENPRVYGLDFALDNTTSPVTSLNFNRLSTGGQRAAIFGLSATAGAVAPIILTQPASYRVFPGSNLVFSVTASGTEPFTYQWQKGTNSIWVEVAGATAAQLSLNNVNLQNEADYRVIVQNTAGSATSSVASLIILSDLQDVTSVADTVTGFGGTWPGGEPPSALFNDTTLKYLNFGTPREGGAYRGPLGAVVTPAVGRTIVSGARIYTANDAAERDPMDFKLEGSVDGGSTWTLIVSNALSLPLARNGGNDPLDPLAQNLQQLRFTNNAGYTTYRITFDRVRASNANSIQVGEVELLGVVDNSGAASITAQPQSMKAYEGTTAFFSVTATGNPAPTYQWKKVVNGTPVALTEGSKYFGVTSSFLNISDLKLEDAGEYLVTVSNGGTPLNSMPAQLTVLSMMQDVTSPSDEVSVIGDESNGFWGDAANGTNIVDNTTTKYRNGGSGFSAAAGFAPFEGPVGVIITPAMGATRVSGLRVYTADDNVVADPADYKLEGSIDGNNWTLISEGPLSLPEARNGGNNIPDPLNMNMQEVIFPNTAGFLKYRLTFSDVKDYTRANSMQVAEIELLGFQVPHLTYSRTGDSLSITSTMPGTLQSSPSPSGPWTDVGPITGTTVVQIQAGASMYYRVQMQQ